ERMGCFRVAGPTGVGKTEVAKQLAQIMGIEFIRFDMSEYMEKHTVSRLIGAPPGYVGFDQGGLLTDAINRNPYAVLLLDEIEKAHPDLFNILLQVMDHATLTDNNGKKADFRNIILIMTTNAGAREMSGTPLGFGARSNAGKGKEAIEKMFSPEFRNRLDAMIVFNSLTMEIIERVVDKFIIELDHQLNEKKVFLQLTVKARRWLAERGYDPSFGARPMARLIQNEIKRVLADEILFGQLQSGGKVEVDENDGKLTFTYSPLVPWPILIRPAFSFVLHSMPGPMEQLIVAVFLVLFGLEFVVEFGLNELNLRYVRAKWVEKKLPDFFQHNMTAEQYDKSVQYTLAKGRFQRWAEVYGRLITLIVLFSGLLPSMDRFSKDLANRFFSIANAEGLIFCFGVALVFSMASLPTDLYSTFELEARFGFNKTTWKLYLTDKLKGLLLGVVIGLPFLFVVLWLMKATGSYWWLWTFLFVSGFQLLMVIVYPTLIAPLFNKFESLPEGELRNRILRLAEQVGFKTNGIFSMDGSKRSAHSNAYFTGIGKAKRIVLF